ncbi:hypothetical protein TBLA_0C04040 [Henningerozyma blattae CBS 6284]|uniref:PUM-HD domain-containing protein n=1 Tax=Henningerozyma blattae (strain ATCC 34711 / CBS 6284 / DSM 70876 / NBRC 10599 / NRRL Y-10934 / UCD 77-7) TaxID=1071380 RepID=I2H1F2_HENB6|nr:hypothetical protein TBLA_0C04040 [Tetrapisispora blattae CBS 6284]CCH60204.1 hypothetical protein TBLA_0C04040 [Tetrapisispora blattae CBS 6284]
MTNNIKKLSEDESLPLVDPVVTETINSALNQLHLDDSEDSTPPTPKQLNALNMPSSLGTQAVPSTGTIGSVAGPLGENTMGNGPPSQIFSPLPPQHFQHQMLGMGFMPYSQMMHMPPTPGTFFPSPDFTDPSLNMIPNSNNTENNSPNIFAKMDNKLSPTNLPSQSVWPPTIGSIHEDGLTSGSVSSIINDSNGNKKAPGAATNSFRRQTFHTLPSAELMGISQANGQSSNDQLSIPNPSTRTQSISFDKSDSTFLFSGSASGTTNQASNAPPDQLAPKATTLLNDSKDVKEKENSADISVPKAYAAAYPYGGPLLHPNPILSNPHDSSSNPHGFNVTSQYPGGYGFNGPFPTFSPVMGGPHPPIHGPTPISVSNTSPLTALPSIVDGSNENKNKPAVVTSTNPQLLDPEGRISPSTVPVLNPMQIANPQGSSPPPWLYQGHSFSPMVGHPQGPPPPPHMLNQNGHLLNRNGKFSMHEANRHNPKYPVPTHEGPNGTKNEKYSNYTNNSKNGKYSNNGKNNFNNYPHGYRKVEDNSFYADAELSQFIGNIYSICTDQYGCRFLQKQLDVLGKEAADIIFNETKDHTVELMTDSFGNYLIQKLLERITLEQRIIIANISSPHFVEIALNPHGTRALQKLVECTETDEESNIIVKSLTPSILMLSKDLNGNHVVQKCLQKMPPKHFQFIFDAACKDFIEIATHRHGCCVLQRCLDHGTEEQRHSLCNKLLENIDMLTMDPFGNYVVQYVITKESDDNKYDFTYKIVHLLKPKVIVLSLHKFGSNVVEKLLRTPIVSETVILELLNKESNQEIQTLLNDSYGNYVLQTALAISSNKNPYLYKKLSDIVTPLLVGPIRNTPHGRRILSKLPSGE